MKLRPMRDVKAYGIKLEGLNLPGRPHILRCEGIECVADCSADRVDSASGCFVEYVLELAKDPLAFRSGEYFGRRAWCRPNG